MTDTRGIYRGPGGSGDAVADTSNESATAIAAADAAAASQVAAAASATAAASSATSAASSASTASTAATNASSSASSASTSATNAASSATSASNSADDSQTAADDSAASATLAQDWATKTSGPVAGGEYSAKYHASAAASSATTASSSATTATTQASLAASSATSAASSASTATTKASEASTSASNAATSASAASSSASSASSSASSASSSASTATTKAGEASTSATNAATSASSASTSASNASTSASNAASSASSASSSATAASAAQVAAETARDQTLTAYDNFDDRYLGSKTSDPSLDNDGNALLGGALYFNSTDGVMKVYTGSAWVAAYASGGDFLAKANNLSDLPNTATARTNLGLGTAATTAATDYATAAQGTKADTAYGWGNHASAGYLTSLGIGSLTQAYDSNLTSFVGTFTLPTTDGSNGQVLGTNGSGTLSFVTPSTVGSLDDLSDVTITSPTTDQVLKYNGSAWVNGTGGSSNITTKGLYENANTISANYTIGTNNNAMSSGPITVASGVTVTVPSGSNWVIL
jgi:hypothetical protein